jgi:hypothetical protein
VVESFFAVTAKPMAAGPIPLPLPLVSETAGRFEEIVLLLPSVAMDEEEEEVDGLFPMAFNEEEEEEDEEEEEAG